MNFKHLSYCAIPFFFTCIVSKLGQNITEKNIQAANIPKNDLIQTPQQCYDEFFQSY